MERVKNAALGILLALFAAALVCFPAESAAAARQGLSLCLQTVLPSLFPFFVLSSLCVACGMGDALAHTLEPLMRPLFGLSGAGAVALALGLVGGYPVGARTAAELYRTGRLYRDEAERLLGFCNNCGPGFILGVCGSAVFCDMRAGLLLALIHAAAAILTGFLLRRSKVKCLPPAHASAAAQAKSLAAAFPSVVRDSFSAVWSVCGFVVLFAVLLQFVTLLLPARAASAAWYPALLGLVELTNGVAALPSGRVGFTLCAAMLGWGGLSVHAQTLSVLEETDLSPRWYFLGKIMQAALSAPLALIGSRWLF